MKYKIIIALISLLIISCKKEKKTISIPNGIYVEETLRLDTMDFTLNNRVDAISLFFKFTQPLSLILPPFPTPGNDNVLYEFEIQLNTTINIRSMLGSNSNFKNYFFNWISENNFFEIEKFYSRNNLPSRLKFVKL